MNKKFLGLVFLFLSLSVFSEIIVPSEAFQGDVLTVYYSSSSNAVKSFSCEIQSEKSPLKSNGFIYSRYRHQDLWICFIAIPMDYECADYKFTYSVNSKTNPDTDYKIKILPAEFITEEIPLNKEMTSLDKNNTKQRRVDRKELKELLKIYNRNAVYKSRQFNLPLTGKRFSSYYGDKRIYKYNDGSISKGRHHGLDIAAPTGSIIKAGAGGKIVMAKFRVISGYTVVIEYYPGFYGLYYHLDKIWVKTGQVVSPDTVIGTVGSTGLVTGPHLHWQIMLNNIAVNPEKLLADLLIDKDKINSIID